MPNYSRNEVVLVRYPFSALSGVKVRPAVIVNAPHVSQDVFLVPLTSHTTSLLAGEFVLADWAGAGLHVPTAVKRGLYTVQETFVLKRVGQLTPRDAERIESSLRAWLGLPLRVRAKGPHE
jgi:PemK-like, MazF-like toxin of type II toxin-antitoxin system